MAGRVSRDPEDRRYEIRVDGEVAGYTEFHERPGIVAFVHTEIDPAYEGQGLGSELVGGALDDARERKQIVLPFCEFVNGYLQRHREYADLVPEDLRGAFDLSS